MVLGAWAAWVFLAKRRRGVGDALRRRNFSGDMPRGRHTCSLARSWRAAWRSWRDRRTLALKPIAMSWQSDPLGAFTSSTTRSIFRPIARLRATTGEVTTADHEAGGIPGAGRTGASALLLEWLQSSDAEVRLAVVEALAGAESNTDDERAALERACLDSDEDVRDAALEAIETATWQGSELLGRELSTLSAQSASAARWPTPS